MIHRGPFQPQTFCDSVGGEIYRSAVTKKGCSLRLQQIMTEAAIACGFQAILAGTLCRGNTFLMQKPWYNLNPQLEETQSHHFSSHARTPVHLRALCRSFGPCCQLLLRCSLFPNHGMGPVSVII